MKAAGDLGLGFSLPLILLLPLFLHREPCPYLAPNLGAPKAESSHPGQLAPASPWWSCVLAWETCACSQSGLRLGHPVRPAWIPPAQFANSGVTISCRALNAELRSLNSHL